MAVSLQPAEHVAAPDFPRAGPRHVDPAMYDRYSGGPSRADYRQYRRRPLRCSMLLIESGDQESDQVAAIPGECFNVSEGGLYGTVPTSYGPRLGQRYVFRLTVHERGPEPGSTQIVSQEGVVVRTEFLLDADGTGSRTGVAVRLSGHRSGVIAMPS